jgi:hypothetical protein
MNMLDATMPGTLDDDQKKKVNTVRFMKWSLVE